MATNTLGYEAVKQLAKQTGCNIPDLLVLARNNDPFYAGGAAQQKRAEWFAELWGRFGYSSGVHLRRVHYQLVSQHDPQKHDGTPYENTEGCWGYLSDAAKHARYLGLVSVEGFVDRRNPTPHLHAYGPTGGQWVSWDVDLPVFSLPTINTDIVIGEISLDLDTPYASGYGYSASEQPYHIELWIEKSTVDDVLLPVCRELGVNLVTSLGFQSITSIVALLKRIASVRKPARVFYVSDFDPAGDGMPTAVARQIEYWAGEHAPGIDIKLTPIVLTREQTQHYRLPRIPIKDEDRRKGNFEARYGEGAVELDALEALYPGELARIIKDALLPYRDLTLEERLQEADEEANELLEESWDEKTQEQQGELEDIRGDIEAIFERRQEQIASIQSQLEEIRGDLESELEPYRERLQSVRHAIQNARRELQAEIELPERPRTEIDDPDESDWLFDSRRDYMTQLEVYKARQSVNDRYSS